MFDEIDRMEPLVTAQPIRIWRAQRLAQMKKRLRSLREASFDCAGRRRQSEIQLARSSADSGDRIASDVKSRDLVSIIKRYVDWAYPIARHRVESRLATAND